MKKTELPIPLPKGVNPKDLEYPSYKSKVKRLWDLDLTLYCVARRDGSTSWVIATLPIGGGRRRTQYAARTYGVEISSGSLVRVGQGPHVLATVTVYVTEANKERLAALLELSNKGAVEANQVRDRISSRRAQGQLMRAEGRRSWTWDV